MPRCRTQSGGQTFTVEEVYNHDEPNESSDDGQGEEQEILSWLDRMLHPSYAGTPCSSAHQGHFSTIMLHRIKQDPQAEIGMTG